MLYRLAPAIIIFFASTGIILAAEIPQDLRNAIDSKSKELQEINQKILQTQKDLNETEGRGKTLQKEIKKLDLQLNQLNLGMRSSEINIEKLNLEIQELGYDLKDVRDDMSKKKSGVSQILREIQARDNETLLHTLLKGKTLAEDIDELVNLQTINETLSSQVSELAALDDKLSNTIDTTSQKKKRVESERENIKNKKLISSGQKSEQQLLLQTTKNQEKVFESQINELKNLQAAVSAEVEKIEAELRKKIDPSLLPTPRPGALAWPVTMKDSGGYGRLTQKWGLPSWLYGGKAHNGIDIGAPIGTPVFATEKGKIIEVWNQDKYCYKGAYGKFIVIEHENNLTTLYAHLSLQSVNKGDIVERGQIIGYVGSTGYATGPHLHLTVYASQTFIIRPSKVNCGPIMPFGGDLDPLQYL
mgnify:FL=1